ncbi:MAG TPA: peptidylprolyl isomerase [Dongiaceae bacterium]|jgi:peptidyl-prolyl cis-trans isomerase C|nr:peptidylprolyl isomerase [Dongiaceae bacterium]
MALASFRATLLAGATAILAITAPVIAAAQDSNTANTQDAAPAAPAPDGNAQATTPGAAPASGDSAQPEAAAPAPAAPADPKEVVATVNGQPITRQDVIDSAANLPPQYQAQIDAIFPQLLNRLIGFDLVSEKGRSEGLADDPEVKKLVKQFEDEAIRQVYFSNYVKKAVTDDAIKQVYDADLAAHPPQPEIRAAHILVKTEDEAKAIIDQLGKGADFAQLAKEKSIDTQSGKDGGELGWFSKDTMVKEFSDAAFAMQRGDISKTPVKSQFGWHIIKIEDSRMQIPPTLEQRKDEIRQVLAQEAAHKLVQDLIGGAKVDYSKPEYKVPAEGSGQ